MWIGECKSMPKKKTRSEVLIRDDRDQVTIR